MWAVLTRPRGSEEAQPVALQKMKLYDGKVLPGTRRDTVKELRKERQARGHGRQQPALRAGQDLQRVVKRLGEGTINPFMVMNELDKGLRTTRSSPTRSSASATRRSSASVSARRGIVKNEVQRAISPTRTRSQIGCKLHRQHQGLHPQGKVKNRYTGQDEDRTSA